MMMRVLIACCAFGLTAGVSAVAEDAPTKAGQKSAKTTADMTASDRCAKACGQCALICDKCAAHCAMLVAEGKKEHLTTLKTCQDCASVCAAAACITARSGPFSDVICKACAEACNKCGAECDKHASDPMMKKCADECKACEKACRDMLGAAGAQR